MIIPHQQLPVETLHRVIEDWLSRQSQEMIVDQTELPDIINQVIDQLERGLLAVTWDDVSQTINIIDPRELDQLPSI